MQQMEQSVRAGDDIAKRILATLKDLIGCRKFEVWFSHPSQLAVDNEKITVRAANSFIANWIKSHYCTHIATAAREHLKTDCSVCVSIDAELNNRVEPVEKQQLDDQTMVTKVTSGNSRKTRCTATNKLRYRLEDFVVGKSNRLAYSAAIEMNKGDKVPFNPLFIHGPCGVGKTHLLQGICASMAQSSSLVNCRWKYVTAEAFTNEYVSSLKNKKLDSFRSRYRNLDLLVIDDVHFLAAKRATQDEFLHTFNAIADQGNPIVMASDTHPRLVGSLNEQLVSRFMSGMVVTLDIPDIITRREILKRRVLNNATKWNSDVLEYIAQHVCGSVRELEGAITKLTALTALAGQTMDIDLVKNALADHFAKTHSTITIGDIEAVTAEFFGVTQADIRSARRTKTISVARSVTVYLARHHTRMSYPEIGRAIAKNHSSVVLGVKRVEKLLDAKETIAWSTSAGGRELAIESVIETIQEKIR